MALGKQAIRWAIGSGLSFGINVGLAVLLHEVFAVPERIAYLCALVTVFFVNFFVARYFVFESRAGSGKAQLGKFLGSTLAFRGAEYVAFLVIMSLVADDWYPAIIVVVSVVSLTLKFFVYRAFVFKAPQPAVP